MQACEQSHLPAQQCLSRPLPGRLCVPTVKQSAVYTYASKKRKVTPCAHPHSVRLSGSGADTRHQSPGQACSTGLQTGEQANTLTGTTGSVKASPRNACAATAMSNESAKLGESMETSVKPEADRMKPVARGGGPMQEAAFKETAQQERKEG